MPHPTGFLILDFGLLMFATLALGILSIQTGGINDWIPLLTQLVVLAIAIVPVYLKIKVAADESKAARVISKQALDKTVETHDLVNGQSEELKRLTQEAATQQGILRGIEKERADVAAELAARAVTDAATSAGVAAGLAQGAEQQRVAAAAVAQEAALIEAKAAGVAEQLAVQNMAVAAEHVEIKPTESGT